MGMSNSSWSGTRPIRPQSAPLRKDTTRAVAPKFSASRRERQLEKPTSDRLYGFSCAELEDLKLRVIGHMDRTKQLLSSAYNFECLMEQGGNPTSLAALFKEQGKKIPSRPKALCQWKRLSRLIINQERQHIVGR